MITLLLSGFNLSWASILIHLLNLGVLIVVLWFLFHKPIRRFIEHREKEVKDKLDEADRILNQAKNNETKEQNSEEKETEN